MKDKGNENVTGIPSSHSNLVFDGLYICFGYIWAALFPAWFVLAFIFVLVSSWQDCFQFCPPCLVKGRKQPMLSLKEETTFVTCWDQITTSKWTRIQIISEEDQKCSFQSISPLSPQLAPRQQCNFFWRQTFIPKQ